MRPWEEHKVPGRDKAVLTPSFTGRVIHIGKGKDILDVFSFVYEEDCELL